MSNPTLVDSVIGEYYWQAVAGDGSLNFVVVQLGNTIEFYQVGTTSSLSSGRFSQTLNLDTYKVNGSPSTAMAFCQFASGYGYLFICHPYCDPIYVIYNPTTTTFSFNSIILQQRDITGLIDNTYSQGVNYRPQTLTDYHYYNLINQGWINPSNAPFQEAGTNPYNGYAYPPFSGYIYDFDNYFTGNSYVKNAFPSNADVWYLFKNQYGVFDPSTTLPSVGLSNSPAPKGYFILDCFYQDRAAAFAAAGLTTTPPVAISVSIPVVSSGYQRPSTVAFFAGRVWWAGVQATNFTNQIYYSQILQPPEVSGQPINIAYCYQQNDPSASDLAVADLIASDGGVLIYPEIGQIYKMFSMAYSLLLIASNGVWSISGSTGSGFTATDFTVSKLSSVGALSAQSFIDYDGTPIWWNMDGIYTVGGGGTSPSGQANMGVISLSDPLIKTYFDAIPAQSKMYVKGSYNRSQYSIYWLYNNTVQVSLTNQFFYTNALIYNTNTKAFYDWELPSNVTGTNPETGLAVSNIYISGLVTIQGAGTVYEDEDVTTPSGDIVYDSEGNIVETLVTEIEELPAVTKWLTQFTGANSSGYLTWSEASDISYMDFTTNDFTSFLSAGYSIAGQGIGKFQAPYVVFYMNDTLANAVTINGAWDFNTLQTSNRLQSYQTVQSEGSQGAAWKEYRRKIRGSGRALQLTMTSVSGQPFETSGWALELGVNNQA